MSEYLRRCASLAFFITALAGLMVSCTMASTPAPEGNLVRNPDFEQPGDGVPPQWIFEERVQHKGDVGITERSDSGSAVTLRPNARNVVAEQESNPMGIGQVFSLKDYPGLRGATLHVSARMGATRPATARVRLIAIRKGGEFIGTVLEQGESKRELVEHSNQLAIPDDGRTMFVVLGLDALGTSGQATFDDIYLGTTPKRSQTSKMQDVAPIISPVRIRIDAARTVRRIPESLYGVNIEWIWDANGLWDAKQGALNENLVRLTRDLRPALMRFPGGIFADFYHWRDGIGPHSQRPVTHHMPGGPQSKHNFGTDEALEFARRTGSELMITVNISTGTPEEAVEWLRYVNRPDKTKGQPPKVKLWEIGNENYYYGDAPYLKRSAHDGEQYARRFLTFAEALKKADPRISIVAITEENYQSDFKPVHPDWTRLLLSQAGRSIDYLAIHNGYVPGLEHDHGWDLRTVYRAMLAAPIQLRRSLDRVSVQLREFAPKHASRIKLAVTEWAPSFQIALDGRFLDHPKTLGSALFVASNLKNYIEHPDMEIANFFKLSGRLWQGMIGSRNGKFIAKAPYHAFRMYREHFGPILVETQTGSPTYNAEGAGYVPALNDVPYLDVVSSLSEDGQHLYVMVINKHFDQDIPARIEIAGFKPRPKGRSYVLTGTGIDAHTGTQLFKAPGVKWARQAVDDRHARFDKGGPGEITITEHPFTTGGNIFEYSFAKHSVTAIDLVRVGP